MIKKKVTSEHREILQVATCVVWKVAVTITTHHWENCDVHIQFKSNSFYFYFY